jgi:asparagine synthase (glutamine-hydrolysing)
MGETPWLVRWQFLSHQFFVAPTREPVNQSLIASSGIGYLANRAEFIKRFALPSDATEQSILHALYQHGGAEFAATQIRGDYCWVLVDYAANILCVCRDAVGLSPLYYAVQGETAWVSDSAAAILDAAGLPCDLDREALAAHVCGLAPDVGHSFYRSVKSVPPGTLLVFKDSTIQMIRYWEPSPKPVLGLKNDLEYVEAYCALMQSVSADYSPPGNPAVTLSSGLDTNSLSIFLRNNYPDQKIIGLGFIAPDIPQANEEADIRLVAERAALDLITLRHDQAWPLRQDGALTATRSGPTRHFYYDIWIEAFRCLQQTGANFLQTGGGGDELFGGNVVSYPDLLFEGRFFELFRQLRLHFPRSTFSNPAVQIPRRMVLSPIANWLRYYSTPAKTPVPPALESGFHEWFAARNDFENKDTLPWMLPGRLQRLLQAKAVVSLQMFAELSALGRAHSFPIYEPFLDRKVFDFALSLPSEQTFYAGQHKTIMIRAMQNTLPPSILNRMKKIVPFKIAEYGLCQQETARVWNLLDNMRLAEANIVNEKVLKQLFQDKLDGKKIPLASFYYCITAEGWLRKWFP